MNPTEGGLSTGLVTNRITLSVGLWYIFLFYILTITEMLLISWMTLLLFVDNVLSSFNERKNTEPRVFRPCYPD